MDMNEDADITLSIRELVIDGLSGIDRDPLERALCEELERLLSSDSPGTFRATWSERTAPLELCVEPDSSSRMIGCDLARAIYGAVRRP